MSQFVFSEALLAANEVVEACSLAGERYLIEMAAMLADVKDVVRIQIENDKEYLVLENYSKQFGLALTHSPTRMKVAWTNDLGDTFLTTVPWDDPDGSSFAAYLGKNIGLVNSAALVESEGTAEEIGNLLGYPECCCRAYERLEQGEFWIPVLSERSFKYEYSPWANRYAYLLYGASLFPDYFPCSLSCKGTINLGKAYFDVIKETSFFELSVQFLDLMKRPVVVGDGYILGLTIKKDKASSKFPEPTLYEWIESSGTFLPAMDKVKASIESRAELLDLNNGNHYDHVPFRY